MKKFFNWKAALLLITILAFSLRVYKLDTIPNSLNPDEAALGYTSYSLLRTLADEHGKFLPLSLQSFGDWKLPVYSYVGVVPVALFGLNEFSVRFTSAMAGVAGVLLIYFISLTLFNRQGIGLLSALLFALSPWSIYFSRGAYEVNLATTIFLAGLLAFIKYIYGSKRNVKLLFISFLFFALTMFTQHNYIVFAPLFVLALTIIFRRTIVKNKAFFVSIGVFILFILISYFSVLNGGSNKVSNLVIFNDKNILYERVEKLRGDSALKNQLLERILHTKYLGVPYQIAQNYLNSFSPTFLFDKGGEKLVHNLGDFGNFYLFDAFLLFVGGALLFWNKERSLIMLMAWLFISPIPSAVTRDSPNSTRLFTLMPLFVLIASYGAYQIFVFLKKGTTTNLVIKWILIFLFLLNVVFFLDIYFVHLNTQRARFWRSGYKEIVEVSNNYPNKNLIMQGVYDFPYIFFLFYNKYDPQKFRKEVEYYPVSYNGFRYVKQFGRYKFVQALSSEKEIPGVLYIDNQNFHKDDNLIRLPNGDPVFKYYIGK
ncbi:MAG: glycosyltransferase family 39 protein [Candidatus Levybacteria bacterium]|nr:glycosyltransferase family 39 protein [Candidatus Levybacteria bacterium]